VSSYSCSYDAGSLPSDIKRHPRTLATRHDIFCEPLQDADIFHEINITHGVPPESTRIPGCRCRFCEVRTTGWCERFPDCLSLFLGMMVLLDDKLHTSGWTTSMGVDQNKSMYYIYNWGKFETHFREFTETDINFC
jgi:hypothetical protein